MSLNDAATARPSARPARDTRILVHRVVFAALAAFILLSPAPGQVFGKHSPWLREWVMYSGVGTGLPQGAFHIHDAAGTIIGTLTPLEAMGIAHYPNTEHYRFEGWMRTTGDLWRHATAACDRLENGHRLSFAGRVGTRDGWLDMQVEDVCPATGDAS